MAIFLLKVRCRHTVNRDVSETVIMAYDGAPTKQAVERDINAWADGLSDVYFAYHKLEKIIIKAVKKGETDVKF